MMRHPEGTKSKEVAQPADLECVKCDYLDNCAFAWGVVKPSEFG